MENILNRNVHPLYAVMAFFAAAVVVVLYINIVRRRKGEKQIYLNFFTFIIFFCIQDGIWGLLASGIIQSDLWLMIASSVFHISSALAPLVWTVFFCRSLKELINYQQIWMAYNNVFLLAELCMIVINFFNHFMFFVDETGNYQSTPARKILFYMQFSVYILMAVVSVFSILRADRETTKKAFTSFLWISCVPVFSGVFQMLYPDAPANSAGLCFACILILNFLTQTLEEQYRELKAEAELQMARQKENLSTGVIATLSLEYGPLYLADLTTGSLQVYRMSDMERALPVQELAMSYSEYTPFINKYASEYVVEDKRKEFLEWTDLRHLDEIISSDNISGFNYQRDMKGEVNYYQFCCARVSGSSENLMVFGFRNVDDVVKKEMEIKKELEEALKTARIASEAKTRFLFNMSHDIRTPMNAIMGFTDIAIKHKDDKERVDDSLSKIKTASDHLRNLINDILEMSRIESGTLELNDGPMNLLKTLEGEAQMIEPLAIVKSVNFKADFSEIKNPYVLADELHLNEIMINLLSNAVKYTKAGGEISFLAKQDNEIADGKARYRFEIRDNGIGMSEEYQKHLFEAFSREKTSTVSKQQGAGLGLSIVKRIVDMAGGTISVNSKSGEGSTFTVDLLFTIMDEDDILQYEKENRSIEEISKEFSFNDKKVLLVEDNEMNREIGTEILEEAGLIVDTAEDGEFAVKAVTEKGVLYYDFILMDIQMPVMDGYEATKAIRELPDGDKVTIIALSANAFEEDVKKSLECGMNGHSAKPIDVKVLFEIMKNLSQE